MKRSAICLLVVSLLLICILTACSPLDEDKISKGVNTNFSKIEGRDLLYYDLNTKVVYYLFQTFSGYQGYGYLAPYIDENGSYCRYLDGKIVGINNE